MTKWPVQKPTQNNTKTCVILGRVIQMLGRGYKLVK